MKFSIIDYVGEGPHIQQFVAVIIGGISSYGWNIRVSGSASYLYVTLLFGQAYR